MRKNLITVILIFSFFKSYSQNNNDLSYYFKNFPTSPSTASFLRYGDIQNSEFTGTNSPTIPLYTIQNGDITIPLNLDYTSGNGIKVSDEASSVGLGWNLGMPTIVQSVLGSDDFDTAVQKLKIDLHYQPSTPWGVLNYNDQYLETKDGVSEPAGYIQSPEIGKYTYYYSVYHNLPVNGIFHTYGNWVEYDSSPDIFTLNLFGEKIEFFISNHKDINSSSPVFACLKKGYQIKFDKPTNVFKVIAPNGITYEFGRNEEVRIFGTINRNFVLTKITDKNQYIVNFNYSEYSNVINFIPQSKNLNYNRGSQSTWTPGCGGLPTFWGGQYVYAAKYRPPNLSSDAYQTQQASDSYFISNTPSYNSAQNYLLVSKISGEFGSVDFSYSNREDFPTGRLDNLIVKNKVSNQIVKNIDFQYDYSVAVNNNFQNPDTSSYNEDRMKKRLFLKNIVVNQLEKYRFDYNNPQNLPRKDSYAVDYWGYYNGALNNQTYFAKPTDFSIAYLNQLPITSVNNNKKTSDINFVTSGLLKKMTYPTQGYSVFNYELHNADNLISNYNPSTINTGKGVRLESQANYDFNTNLVNKVKFIYENGYSTNPLDLVKEYVNKKYSTSGGYETSTIISFNSSNNYSASSLSSGDYVGYGKVTKIQVDNANNEKGRIISNYNINPDVFYRFWQDQLPVSIPTTKNSGIENGKLISQIITNSNNQKLQEVINEYDTRYSNIYYGTIFSPISEYLYICKGWTNGGSAPAGDPDPNSIRDVSVVAHYPIFSKESLLSKTKTIDYLTGQELITTSNQDYNTNNFLISKSVTFPDGKYNAENIQYSTEKGNTKLINANILNTPLQTQTIGNLINGSLKTTSLIETKYDNISHLNPTSVLSYNIANNQPSTEVTYDLYDKGNLLQYTTKEGTPITIIWGYKSNQPIAKVEGGNYSQVMQAFGLDANNNTSYQQLEIVEKSNLDIDPISEGLLISKLDGFRNKPELKDFKITTYAYDPLIGVKTIIQPSGLREVYKYDSSNRLENIKDNEGKIIKEFVYNHAPIRYYNSSKNQTFTKSDCGSNVIPGVYTYTVPESTYISLLSQADADQQAQNDINANGQNAANVNASCTSMSCSITKGSGISQFNYGSISLANTTSFRIQMGFRYYNNLSWDNGVIIGKINGNCIPSGERSSGTFSNGIWILTIDSNGNITAKISSASPSLVNNMDLNFDFTFPIN
ncbi:DUF5977 domain-containing protein [Chryseobacterium sp. IT-36CA2]|uniref:DUF5977 domain-containing protein n=1 Tax=Chryseobacterium sp. IT-36CA2 TaxID=3026460 RepID=UPI0039E1325D